MRMLLNVTFNDGNKRELQISAADIVATEDHFEISVDNLERYSHLCFLAWCSDSRTKQTGKDFKDWLLDIDTVETVNDPKEPTTKL